MQQTTATPGFEPNIQKGDSSQRHTLPPTNLLGHGSRLDQLGSSPAGEFTDVFVELKEPSIASLHAQSPGSVITQRAATQRQLQRIDAAQQALLATLTGPTINATVLGRVQYVLNGVAIRVEANQLPAIRALPGVTSVWALRIGHYDTQSPPQPSPDMQIPSGSGRDPQPAPGFPVEAPVQQ